MRAGKEGGHAVALPACSPSLSYALLHSRSINQYSPTIPPSCGVSSPGSSLFRLLCAALTAQLAYENELVELAVRLLRDYRPSQQPHDVLGDLVALAALAIHLARAAALAEGGALTTSAAPRKRKGAKGVIREAEAGGEAAYNEAKTGEAKASEAVERDAQEGMPVGKGSDSNTAMPGGLQMR